MLKCPVCQKRVLGQDLITGICSDCGKNLGGSGDSSLMYEPRTGDPTSDTIDPFTVSGAAEAASGSQIGLSQGSHSDAANKLRSAGPLSGSEQTFLSDEVPEEARESLLGAARQQVREQGVASGSEQTFLSDFAPEDSVSESHLAPAPGTGSGSEQTFLSDDFVDSSIDSAAESPFATASSSHQAQAPDTGADRGQMPDDGGSAQTFVSDDFSDEISATMASDSGPEGDVTTLTERSLPTRSHTSVNSARTRRSCPTNLPQPTKLPETGRPTSATRARGRRRKAVPTKRSFRMSLPNRS